MQDYDTHGVVLGVRGEKAKSFNLIPFFLFIYFLSFMNYLYVYINFYIFYISRISLRKIERKFYCMPSL